MFWMCDVSRFGYYREHATEFDSSADALTYMRYAGVRGKVLPASEAKEFD